MLKNKKAVYILIPINLLVWGFFAYRFYSAFTETDSAILSTSEQYGNKSMVVKDSVAYNLSLDYKDPFLKDYREPRSAGQTYPSSNMEPQPKKHAPKIPVVVPPKQIPEIKYLGLIKKHKQRYFDCTRVRKWAVKTNKSKRVYGRNCIQEL